MVATERAGPPKLLARLRRPLLVLVSVIVLLVALVPTILSSARFRNSILAEANAALQGTVELDDFEVTWSGRQAFTGLRLWPAEPGEGEPLLTVPDAAFEKDVLPMLLGRLVLRGRVEGFDARLVVHPDGHTNLEEFLGTRFRTPLRERIDAGLQRLTAPHRPRHGTLRTLFRFLPPIVADVRLSDGTALLIDEGRQLTTGVEDLGIELVSEDEEDALQLRVSATVLHGERRGGFRMVLRMLDGEGPPWDLVAEGHGLAPGTLSAPLLAAALPLLTACEGQPELRLDAPLDLDVRLSGPSLPDLLDGRWDGLDGRIEIVLGPGTLDGGTWAAAHELLGRPPAGFGGYRATLRLRGDRLTVEQAALAEEGGELRPFPFEGGATLDGRLQHRVPLRALLPAGSPAPDGPDGALLITGPWAAPTLARLPAGGDDPTPPTAPR